MALTAPAAVRGGSAAPTLAGRPGCAASGPRAGFTLIELIIVAALLSLLVVISLPVVKYTVKRVKEMELRAALRTMRNAVDEYKRFSDAGLLPIDLGTDGYPKDLEVLVEGVDVVGQVDRKVKFLRRIPMDPMTGDFEWGLRSYQDAFDSDSWGGENVFDVYSLSEGIGLNGVPYSQW